MRFHSIQIPAALQARATAVAKCGVAVEGALGRYGTIASLAKLPATIDDAIAQLEALKAEVPQLIIIERCRRRKAKRERLAADAKNRTIKQERAA